MISEVANTVPVGSLPHTKSEMKTTFDNGKNGAPNEDEDENDMVQRLGMGQGVEGWNNKGNGQSCILWSKTPNITTKASDPLKYMLHNNSCEMHIELTSNVQKSRIPRT